MKIGKKPFRSRTVPCGWTQGKSIRLAENLPLPEGVTMILRSPPGMKGLPPCRPGALTRRCERPGASMISSRHGIFTAESRGEGGKGAAGHSSQPTCKPATEKNHRPIRPGPLSAIRNGGDVVLLNLIHRGSARMRPPRHFLATFHLTTHHMMLS